MFLFYTQIVKNILRQVLTHVGFIFSSFPRQIWFQISFSRVCVLLVFFKLCVCASHFDNVIFHLSKHFVFFLLVQGTINCVVCSILGFLYNMICEDATLCCTNRSHKTCFSSYFVISSAIRVCVTFWG